MVSSLVFAKRHFSVSELYELLLVFIHSLRFKMKLLMLAYTHLKAILFLFSIQAQENGTSHLSSLQNRFVLLTDRFI
jgi:hypothetical protein